MVALVAVARNLECSLSISKMAGPQSIWMQSTAPCHRKPLYKWMSFFVTWQLAASKREVQESKEAPLGPVQANCAWRLLPLSILRGWPLNTAHGKQDSHEERGIPQSYGHPLEPPPANVMRSCGRGKSCILKPSLENPKSPGIMENGSKRWKGIQRTPPDRRMWEA